MLRREPANRRPTVGILLRVARLVVRRPSVVIGLWVVLAAVLSVTFAPLTQVVREHHEEILPSDAPVMVATRQMTESFHETKAENVVLVVLTNEHGLTRADEDVYRTLVDRLRRDTRDVVIVQDFITTPRCVKSLPAKTIKPGLYRSASPETILHPNSTRPTRGLPTSSSRRSSRSHGDPTWP